MINILEANSYANFAAFVSFPSISPMKVRKSVGPGTWWSQRRTCSWKNVNCAYTRHICYGVNVTFVPDTRKRYPHSSDLCPSVNG